MVQYAVGAAIMWLYHRHETQFKAAFGSESELRKLIDQLWEMDVRGFRTFVAKMAATTVRAWRWSKTEVDEFITEFKKHLEDDNSDTKPQPPDAA